MKLALLGFDGLDPRIVHSNPDKLPNLHEFMSDSMHGEWNTPGHTIPSFTATMTGRQYNVCNFHWDEGRGDYQRHRQTELDYMWDIMDSSMTLINIPVLYPPEDIDDAMVCGFLTPDSVTDSNLARPQEVQELANEMGYIHDVHADRTFDEMGAQGMFDHLCEMMEKRAEFAYKMIGKYDSDLFYCVWTAPDRWFHQCHKHGVDYMPMYEKVDEIIGKWSRLTDSNLPVMAFSDHGFAHIEGDEGVHKGHMYKGWYSINYSGVPACRDDSASIFDLFPTVVNYLEGEVPDMLRGRILFHPEEQNSEVEARLRDLGYLE